MSDVTDVEESVATLTGFAADLAPEAELSWEVDGDRLFYDVDIDGDVHPHVGETEWPSGIHSLGDLFVQLHSDLMEDLGRMWPPCPAHGSHPLVPTETDWVCMAGEFDAAGNASLRWGYGSLHNYDVPTPLKGATANSGGWTLSADGV